MQSSNFTNHKSPLSCHVRPKLVVNNHTPALLAIELVLLENNSIVATISAGALSN